MSLIRNTPGQFLYGVLVNNNGEPAAVDVILTLAKDGGVPGLADAALTYRGNGLWEAALSQEDTNAEIFGYVFSGVNVIVQGGTIVTVDYPRDAIPAAPAGSYGGLPTVGSEPMPTPDEPCLQNPSSTIGPTTEPLLVPTQHLAETMGPTTQPSLVENWK